MGLTGKQLKSGLHAIYVEPNAERTPAAECSQTQTGKARVAQAAGQGKAGVASNLSVPERPS